MKKLLKVNNQGGAIPILLLVAAVGLLIFLFISNTFSFKDRLFNTLFPKPPSHAASDTNTAYNLGVLVIKYFPLTPDSQKIDITVTGDVGDPYTTIRQRTIDVTSNLKIAIEKAAQSSLTYQIIDTKEYTQAVPMVSDGSRKPDYNGIMTVHNICDYVENKGVAEVWLWAYQGPTYPGSKYPYLNISESKMASLFGDISNSPRLSDMPVCKNTYRVYTFNYGRLTSEALESWGHQIEAEISAVDNNFFRNLWQGPNYPQTLGVNGRCGSVHNPPNARSEYDRNNPNPQNSDCLDWNADAIGTLSQISCQNWGCADIDPLSNNASLNYMIWNWQNLPGRNNTKTYLGSPLRNLWDIHGNFDQVMGFDKTIFLNIASPTPTPTPTPNPISTPTPNPILPDTTPPSVSTTNPINGSTIKANSTVNITASASDNVKVSKVEFLVNNSVKCTSAVTPYTCSWKVPGKKNVSYTISAKASDSSNNTSSSTITVKAQ